MPGYCTFPRPLTYEGPCDESAVNLFVNRTRRLPGMGKLTVKKSREGFLAFPHGKAAAGTRPTAC